MKSSRKNPFLSSLPLQALTAFLIASPLSAADAYWDSNGLSAGAGSTPTGTWGTDAFWNATATGDTTSPVAWVSGDVAIFSAGTDATAAYTVTLSGTQTIGGLTVEEGTPTISGGTALALNAAATPFNITGTANISSVISGTTFGIAKSGPGVLVLSGVNTYTGPTSVTDGTLRLGNAAGLGASSLVTVASGAALDLAGFAGGRPVEISGTGIGGATALYNSSNTTAASVSSLKLNADATIANLAVTSGTPDWSKPLTINGQLDLNGKKLTITNGVVSTGGIRNITSGDIEINSGGILTSQNGGSLTAVTGTITINSGGKFETRDLDNTAMTTVHNIVLNGGTIGRATIQNNNGGGGGTILKNNITVDATNGGTITNLGAFAAWGEFYRLTGSLSGSGALSLNGNTGVEFRGDTSGYTGTATATNGTTSFNTTGTQVFNGILAGARPVQKVGSGTTTFAGANTYTGATTVSAGTLVLSGANTGNSAFTVSAGATLGLDYATQDNSKLHNSSVLTLSGGTVNLSSATGSHVEVVASTTLTANTASTINRSGANTAVLALNAITRNTGATLNFGASGIATTDTLNNSSGILGTWATIGGGEFAVNSTNTADGLITAPAYNLTSVALDTAANYTDRHMSVDSSQTLGGAITPFTLNYVTSGAYTLTLTGTNTIKGGGITATSAVGNNASILTGGTLQAGTAGGDLLVSQANTANTLNIGSVIQNNTSASTLTKGGLGTLVLSGVNTYTGQTNIVSGTLQIGGAGQLGSGTYAGAISNAGALLYSSSAAQTLSGIISGTGALTNDSGSSSLTLNGANTYTGLTTVTTGTLQIGNGTNNTATLGTNTASVASGATLSFFRNGGYTIANALSGAGAISFLGTGVSGQSDYVLGGTNTGYTGNMSANSGSRLQLDAVNDLGSAARVTVNSGGQAFIIGAITIARPFTINGNGWTEAAGVLGALRFAGGSTLSGAVTLGGNSRITAHSSGDTGTISGVITDGASTFGLTKTGAGTVTLTAANTYDGASTLSNGRLNIRNAASLGTGAVTMGDTSSGSNAISLYLDTNRTNFSRAITVSSNGSGTVTLGSMSSVTGTGDNNQFTSINLQRDVTFDSNAADRTDYENISGTGNITVSGVGRSVFITNNTYTGNLTISVGIGGNLQIGTATAGNQNYIPDTTNVTVNDTASNTLSEFRVSVGGETIGALNGNGTVDVNAINATLTVGGNNATGSFSGVMKNDGANTLAMTKIGTGSQTLSGLNTYTGTTTVSGGTLLLDYATNNTGVLASTSPLTLGGGTLNLRGRTGAFTTTQTLASLSLTAGTTSNIVLNPNGGTSTVLTLTSNTLTTGAGSLVNFDYTAGTTNGSTLGNNYVAWNPTLTGGIIGVSYTVTDSGGTGYATVIGGNVLRYVDAGTAGLPVTTGASTDNYFVNSSYSTSNTALAGSLVEALSGAVAANTVTVDTTGLATGANLALAANTLTLTGGGGMIFNGANPYEITATGAGGITSTSGGALVFNNYNSSTVTFSAPILANGVNNVTFNGPGTTVLNRVSTYTGSTTLTGGNLTINGSGRLIGSGTYAGAIAISSGATLNVASTAAQTWSGALSGAGTLIQANSGALTLSSTSTSGLGANSIQINNSSTLNYTGGSSNGTAYSVTTGTVTVASGSTLSLVAREDNGYGSAASYTVGSTLTMNGGTVRLGGDNGAFFQRIVAATSWSLSGANTITSNIGGFGQYQAIEGSISGSGTLTITRGSALGSGRTINLKGNMSGYSGNVTVGTAGDTVGAVTIGNATGWGSGTLSLTGAGSNVLIGDRVATDFNGSWTGGSALSFISGTLSPAGLITVGAGAVLRLNNNTASYAILLQTTGGLTVNGGTVSALGTAGTSAMVPNGTWTFGGSALSTVSANVQLDNASTIFSVADAVAGTGNDTTISGVISGTNGIAKTGAGTLTLSGSNSYSGGSTITAGTLSFANGSLSTSGDITMNGGTLQWNGTNTQDVSSRILMVAATAATFDTNGNNVTFANAIGSSTSAQLVKTGLGNLTLSAASTYTGRSTVSGGTLSVAADNYLGTAPGTATAAQLVINGGTFAATSTFTLASNRGIAIGPGTGTGTGTIEVVSGQTLSYGGILANNGGTGELIKTGTGTLTLSGSGSWTGNTAVNAGTLEVLAKTNDVAYTVASGATLKIGYTTGGNYANTNLQVTGDGVSATTGLYLRGGSSYNASGQIQLITGPTTIRQYGTGLASIGIFDINGDALLTTAAASGSVIDSNIQFVSRGFGMSVNIASGSATATGDLVMNGALNVGSLGFYKRGAGSIALNATANTSNAALNLQGGTVITGAVDAIGPNANVITSSGTKLQMNSFNQAIGTLSGSGQIFNGSATATLLTVNQAAAQTFSGVLGGSTANDNNFAVTKAGSAILTLSGNNTFTGTSTVSAGTLALGNASNTLNDNGAVTVDGATAILSLGTNSDTVGSVTLRNSGSIIGTTGVLTGSAYAFESGLVSAILGGTGVSLAKTTAGTVTLTGANTYTGTTTVSAGTLALVGGSQASPITVSSGASLGFTLGSPTSSTSTFNVTTGTIKITGTATLPSYTLISASTGITGTPTLDAPIAGYRLRIVGDTLVLENPYEVWAAATGATGGKAADPDGDGFNNLMEYAFGTNPAVNSSGSITYSGGVVTATGQPVLVEDAGIYYAVFGRRTDYATAGITYTVQFTAGLDEWANGLVAPTVIATDGTIDAVRVPFPNFIFPPGGPKKPYFFRVEIAD